MKIQLATEINQIPATNSFNVSHYWPLTLLRSQSLANGMLGSMLITHSTAREFLLLNPILLPLLLVFRKTYSSPLRMARLLSW